MASISASVGIGGVNRSSDVVVVQTLINRHIGALAPVAQLAVDGKVGSKTSGAIRAFQSQVLGFTRPDGRVDPGGRTLQALNQEAGTPSEPPTLAARPSFLNLWSVYPRTNDPCDGPWNNQCAIRMSLCLNDEGTFTVNASTYSEPKCSHGHARGAESLANWLQRRLGRPRRFTDPAAAKRELMGSSGIIFFKDCFTRSGETTRRGDHIDLWRNGTVKTYSDPSNKSAQVWFWALS